MKNSSDIYLRLSRKRRNVFEIKRQIRMVSLAGILTLLGIPIRLLFLVIKYFTIGAPCRKFSKSLWHSMRLQIFRSAISLGPIDSYLVAFMSSKFVLHNMVKPFHRSFLSQLPGYGTRYDKNSYWLVKQPDRKKDDPVLIYLHGGGYFIQTNPTQVESVISIYKLVDPEKRKRLSVLLLDYKLVSHGYPMPTQIQELHETYQNLVSNDGSTNILLMGDSAGGNLSLGYLQFLKKSNLAIKVFPKKVILVSPWVKFETTADTFVPGNSFYDNETRDMISYKFLNDKQLKQIVGEVDLKSLQANPGNSVTESENWNDIPTLNNPGYDVFVILGEDESFRDDILAWCENVLDVPLGSQYKYGHSNKVYGLEGYEYIKKEPSLCHVRVYVEPWGIHDSSLFFENHAILKVKNSNPTVDDLDDKEFFGITRIVNFLNDTL